MVVNAPDTDALAPPPPGVAGDLVVDGITFRRPKPRLREAAAAALVRGDEDAAVKLLLADQDRFAPTPPPTAADLDRLLADDPARGGPGALSLREAMDLLSFGPVGDYFAYRWCSPTWLSGLELLSRVAHDGRPVVEVACGIGHYLRALELLGFATVGVDIVYAKLWLARRFLGVRGALVCADIEVDPVFPPASPDSPRTVFCHDAFYFFEHKADALQNMRSLAGAAGTLALGHVHTRSDAHEAGFGESPEAYRGYLPAGTPLLDDALLARRWFEPTEDAAPAARPDAPAVAWTEGTLRDQSIDWLTLADLSGGLRQNLSSPQPHPSASTDADSESLLENDLLAQREAVLNANTNSGGFRQNAPLPREEPRADVDRRSEGNESANLEGSHPQAMHNRQQGASDAEANFGGLRQNPLLATPGEIAWPSDGWREEYRSDAAAVGYDYLAAACEQANDAPKDPEQLTTAERRRGFRERRLVNFPARW